MTYALLLLAFEFAFRAWWIDSAAFASYRSVLAHLSGALIELVGQPVSVHGTVLTSASASFEVVPGCAATETMGFLCLAVLATPVSRRRRLAGVLLGALVLFAANLARIGSLVVLHELSHRDDLVTLAHHGVWPMVLTAASVAIWVGWMRRAAVPEAAAAEVAP